MKAHRTLKGAAKSFLLVALLGLSAIAANAVEPDEILSDRALEARAREIDAQLRCVVCQSQSIAESDAPLARDLRLLVRERIVAGDSNDDVIAFVADRYGDYVLLKPRLQENTAFLWAFPLVAFIIACIAAAIFLRNARKVNGASSADNEFISEDDEAALQQMIDERG